MAMLDVSDDGTRIVIHAEYRERDLVKQVPGARWNQGEQYWAVPLSWGSCQALRGVFGNSLRTTARFDAWAWGEWQGRVEPALAARSGKDGSYPFNFPELFDYQRLGVGFLYTAQRALLCDEMGLGKTVQLIFAAKALQGQHSNALPILVVCPNTLKYTWKTEFNRFWPELRVQVVAGSAAQRRKQITKGEWDVLIINYEALRLHARIAAYGSIRLAEKDKEPKELNAIEWGTVLADEAHRIKDAKSKQTRALWYLAHSARYRFLATGTPIEKSPADLWSVMHTIAPEDWPAKVAYVERYCLTAYNPFSVGLDILGLRPDTKDEFHRILDSRMMRRVKAEVLKELPEKVYQTRWVELSSKQRKAYDEMSKAMVTAVDGGVITAFNALTVMTRLSQFASAFCETYDMPCKECKGDAEGCEKCNETGVVQGVNLMEPSSKIDALLDLIDEAAGEPMVVFAQSRQLINLAETRLTKENIPYVSIHGGVVGEAREDAKLRFQNPEHAIPVLLATVGAAAEGLTLTRARTAVFIQRSYSLLKNKQAEDRVYARVNDLHGATIIDLVGKGTIEEFHADRLAAKEDRLQEIVRDRERLAKLMRGEI